jgi:hypothetical protein
MNVAFMFRTKQLLPLEREYLGIARYATLATPDVAVVIPLKLVYTPVDDTVTAIRNYQVPSTTTATPNRVSCSVASLRRQALSPPSVARHPRLQLGLAAVAAHAPPKPTNKPTTMTYYSVKRAKL